MYTYRLKYTGEGKWGGSYYIVVEGDEGYSFSSQFTQMQLDITVPDTYNSYAVKKLTFSPGYYEFYGDTDEEGNEIFEPEEYSKGEYICMESEAQVMNEKKTCVFEEKVKVKNEMRTLCTYKTPLFDLDGSVMGTVGLAHDITDQKK